MPCKKGKGKRKNKSPEKGKYKNTTGVIRTRKSTAKKGGPSTIVGKPSKKGKGSHKVVYKNTWYNRIRRLNKHTR